MKVNYKSLRDLVAIDNKVSVNLQVEFEEGEKAVSLVVTSKDELIGSLDIDSSLRNAIYTIELDLEGRTTITHPLKFLLFDKDNRGNVVEEPVYESAKNTNIRVEGLEIPEWATYKPYIKLWNFNPKVTNNQLPLIRMKLSRYLRKDKKNYSFKQANVDDTVTISTFINGVEVTDETHFDGDSLTILSLEPLNPGINRIDVVVKFERYGKYVSKYEKVIFETSVPVVRVLEETVYTNKRYPSFQIEIADNVEVGNLRQLSLRMADQPIKFKATGKELYEHEGEQRQPVLIHLEKWLWSGEHEIEIQMSDGAGNKSEAVIQKIWVDIKPPEIIQEAPGSIISAHQPRFLFRIKDNPEPRLLSLPIKSLRGPGREKASRYARSKIYRVRDLLKLSALEKNVLGITPHDLQRTIQRALIITKTGVNPVIYKRLLPYSLRYVLDKSVRQLSQQSGVSETDVRRLKNDLNPLHLSLDTSIINRTPIAEFALIKGSGAGSFRLWLDGEDISDKAILADNEIIYQHDGILDHGFHHIQLEVTDRCGNKSEHTSHFTADKDAPMFFDEYPKDGSFINDTPLTMSVKFQDLVSGIDLDSIKIYLDDNRVDLRSAKISETGVSYNRKRLDETQHQFRVEVDDKAGNHSVFVTKFVYDRTPPEASLYVDNDLHATHDEHVEVRGIVSEMAKSILVNGVKATQDEDLTFRALVPLQENGWHEITAIVEDISGNSMTTNAINIYKVGQNDIAIYGRVLNSEEEVVPGARVFVKKTESWTVADNKGHFCLFTNPMLEGPNLIQVKPPINHADRLQPFNMEVVLTKGKAHTYGDLYLLVSGLEEGKKILTYKPGYTDLQLEGAVNLALPNRDLEFPDDEGKVAISEVKPEHIPVKLPGEITPEQIVSMEPEGLKIKSKEGAPIQFTSKKAFTPGMMVPLFSYSQESGKWTFGAMAKVGMDGRSISTAADQGIPHFSLWTPLLPSMSIDVLAEDVRIPTRPELNPPITAQIQLPEINNGGFTLSPRLIYNSRAAKPEVNFVSIFRGLEEITTVERLGPYTESDIKSVLKALVGLQEHYVKKHKKFSWGAMLGAVGLGALNPVLGLMALATIIAGGATYEEIEQGMINLGSETHFLPFNELESYDFGATYEKIESENHFRELIRNVLAKPFEVYKIEKTITTDVTHRLWPGTIHHRYFLGAAGSQWHTHTGTLTKKGTDNRDTPVLDTNETIRQTLAAKYIHPQTNAEIDLPKGVHDFISLFKVEGDRFETKVVNTAIDEFELDQAYYHDLKRKVNSLNSKSNRTAQEEEKLSKQQAELDKLEAASMAYLLGTELKEESFQWNSSIEILTKGAAGKAHIDDLRISSFGRGWNAAFSQKIFPVNQNKVLVVAGEERAVFTAASEMIDLWWADQSEEMITALTSEESTVFSHWEYAENAITKQALVFARGAKLFRVNYEFVAGAYQFDLPELLLELPGFSERVIVNHKNPEIAQKEVVDRPARQERYKLPWYKWRLVWKGWRPKRVVTWGTRTIPAIKRWVSYWTGGWVNPKIPISDNTYDLIQPKISSVKTDQSGYLYASDIHTHRIFKIDSAGSFEIICGRVDAHNTVTNQNIGNQYLKITQIDSWRTATDFSNDGTIAQGASIHTPMGLEFDLDGNLLFAEHGNHMVRRIKDGKLETIAGNGEVKEYSSPQSIPALGFHLSYPTSISADSVGNIYCLATSEAFERGGTQHDVVKLSQHTDPQGEVVWYADGLFSPKGTLTAGVFSRDFRLINASDLLVDSSANKVFIYTSSRIVAYDISSGLIDTYAGGNHEAEQPNDGSSALEAKLTEGGRFQLNSDGNLLILDPGHHSLRLITKTILGPGNIQLEGPSGYTDSILEKNPSNEWVRTYQDGRKVIFYSESVLPNDYDFEKGIPIKEEISGSQVLTFIYDGAWNLTRIELNSGEYLNLIYDLDDKIVYSEDHLNRRTDYYFNGDDLVRVELPDGTTTTFDYDQDGILIS